MASCVYRCKVHLINLCSAFKCAAHLSNWWNVRHLTKCATFGQMHTHLAIIGHLLCEHKSPWWPMTFWPLNSFTGYSCDGFHPANFGLLRPFRSQVRSRHRTDTTAHFIMPPPYGAGHNNPGLKLKPGLNYKPGVWLDCTNRSWRASIRGFYSRIYGIGQMRLTQSLQFIGLQAPGQC